MNTSAPEGARSGRLAASRVKERLAEIISRRLEQDEARLQQAFSSRSPGIPTRFAVVDDALPADMAAEIHRAFPAAGIMRHLKSFREHKYTLKQLDKVPPILEDLTFAIQSAPVLAAVERITGIREQRPDPSLYAGGLSMMLKGDFLNPHIDNSHDAERRYYRTLNLLYYVTPDWKEEYGGNLELWNEDVTRRLTIPSLFNRLVLMETNPTSWHSVSPVAAAAARCCVSNYYFAGRSPTGAEYFNVTSFSARPEQPVRRAFARTDNLARSALRLLFRRGLGRTDVYTPKR